MILHIICSVLRADIWNHVLTSCIHLFPPFVGLMISANILSELQNGFSDLIISSRKSFLSIFISKLCAVATITLIARLVLLAAKLIWFWGFSYPEKYGSIGIQLPLDKIICWYMANEMVHMPLILLCYIAMPVFIIAVTFLFREFIRPSAILQLQRFRRQELFGMSSFILQALCSLRLRDPTLRFRQIA